MKEATVSETKTILLIILSKELYMHPGKKPTARYSRNTKHNLPEDLKRPLPSHVKTHSI
jgi:hypothetical protein